VTGRERASNSACKSLSSTAFTVFPDMKGFQRLHIGRSIEEDDAFDKLVCMLHLFNRFLAPRLGQHFVAPIVEQTVMQPILVYRGELVSGALLRYSITSLSPIMLCSFSRVPLDSFC